VQEPRVRSRLLVITALLVSSLACATVTSLFNPESAAPEGTEPMAPTIAVIQPTATTAVEPAATDSRRRELTPTPTAFQLSAENDPRSVLDLNAPSYSDSFDNPGTWFDYDDPGQAAYQFQDGVLVGTDYEPEERYTWWSYVERSSGNVYAEISATNGECIGKDAVGFVIRVDEQTAAGGYGVEVACDGAWRFMRYRQAQVAQPLQDWEQAESIETGAGATNRIGIWGYANEFYVFLNGQPVGHLFDRNSLYTYGTFAVYVRALQTYDLTATFDDFAFWHLPFQGG
jgi:hypothetical protein